MSYWHIRFQFDADYFFLNAVAYLIVPVVFLFDTNLFLSETVTHLLGTIVFMLDTLLCSFDWIDCFLAALFFFEDTLGLIRRGSMAKVKGGSSFNCCMLSVCPHIVALLASSLRRCAVFVRFVYFQLARTFDGRRSYTVCAHEVSGKNRFRLARA